MRIIQFNLGISNGFIIQDEKTILLDGGSEGGGKAFAAICNQYNIPLQDISLIIVSHGHVDHYTNIKEIKELTNAPVMCHKEAADILKNGIKPQMIPRNEMGKKIWEDTLNNDPVPYVIPVEADIILGNEISLADYGIHGKLLFTPGHSPCSMTLLLDTKEAFIGDLFLESPITGRGEIAWFADDEKALVQSIYRIIGEAGRIYSGHGGPYSVKEIKQALEKENL